jgi:hypothetical protein
MEFVVQAVALGQVTLTVIRVSFVNHHYVTAAYRYTTVSAVYSEYILQPNSAFEHRYPVHSISVRSLTDSRFKFRPVYRVLFEIFLACSQILHANICTVIRIRP